MAFKNKKFHHIALLIASYFFYMTWNYYLIILIIFSTFLDYFCGKEIYKTEKMKYKKILLVLSLIGNLGLLGFFKYADFFINNTNSIFNILNINYNIGALNLLLPVGISFYTFQTLSYTFDIYRGKLEPIDSFIDFALFVSFFPQLVAGPIVRAKEFLPELKKKIHITPENLKYGITLITWGLVKKIIIADNLAPYVNTIFGSPQEYSSIPIIFATLAFGIQIYCDFSGYSDIAIGSAKIFNINLPINFNKPYLARSISDFWRRWHISLSTWLRDYLYISLGGNRKGKYNTYRNLLITMILGGLWHGAAWNFVIWGIYQGGLLAINKYLSEEMSFHPKITNILSSKIGKIVSVVLTQYLMFLGWIIFRVNSFSDLVYCVKKYIFIDFVLNNLKVNIGSKMLFTIIFGISVIWFIYEIFTYLNKNINKSLPLNVLNTSLFGCFSVFLLLLTNNQGYLDFISVIMLFFVIIHLYSYKVGELKNKIVNYPMLLWGIYLIIVFLLVLFFAPTKSPQFIYFQF